MNLVAWKTVQSRENRPDEFFISFGGETLTTPFFLFHCSEKEARETFGDAIDKITGLNTIHPIKLTLSMIEEE